MTKLSTPPLHF